MSQAKIQAALEVAVKNMAGLVPACDIASSTSGSPTVFTTVEPHGLVTGVCVTIDGHTTVSGSYKFEYVDDATFKLRDLSDGSYVSFGATGVGGHVLADLTEWENVSFSPVVGMPYQRVHVLFGEPENPTFGSDHVREVGFMQITLNYPKQVGTGDVNERVDLIRQTFKRGSKFSFDGINVVVPRTPEKMVGAPLDSTYSVAVRVPFMCDVYS